MNPSRFLPIAFAASLAAPAAAQTNAPPAAAPAPCATEQHRQLDFWVGTWSATWDNANGTKGTGKNVVTRDEYGACVITERFSLDDGSFKGLSISSYVAAAGEWRQTWMDDQGGYFDLFGGPSTEPGQQFGLVQYRRQETAPHLRMVWEDVKPDSFTWRWQSRASADAAWADKWVIRYTRAAPRTAAHEFGRQ